MTIGNMVGHAQTVCDRHNDACHIRRLVSGSRETKGKIGTSLELKGLWENGGKYLGTSSGTKCVTVWQLFSGTSSHCEVGIEHHQNCLNNN